MTVCTVVCVKMEIENGAAQELIKSPGGSSSQISQADANPGEKTPVTKRKFKQGQLRFTPGPSRSATPPSVTNPSPAKPVCAPNPSSSGSTLLTNDVPSETSSGAGDGLIATPPGASSGQAGNEPLLGTTPSGLPSGNAHSGDIRKPKATSQPVVAQVETKIKLTVKQREELKAERERIKVELKAKKEEERLKKEQEKLLREQERREKQLKKEQELKERREKKEREELEKKERREKKEAEKRKKEEEKQKKLEEKKRLEQEKEQVREEKLRRENLAKQKFRGYFGKIEKPVTKKEYVPTESILTPFSVKDCMSLAKPPREPLSDTAEFDQLLQQQDPDVTVNSYIQTCKAQGGRVRHRELPAPREVKGDDDVIIVSPEGKELEGSHTRHKYKLLQFAENHRPAYYGTWRKQRGSVNPRNPLKKDEGLLDYSVDSDEEWEEEEPGESLSSSEGEEKEGEADGEDSDEDDGFFVPHGYLSNDEGDCDDSGGGYIPAPGEDPQDSKRKKQLAKAWETEFARKCQPLEARVIGCLWLQPQLTSSQDQRVLSKEESFLMQFAAVPLVALPLPVPAASKGETSAEKSETQGVGAESCGKESAKHPVPEEAMPDLIRLIHKSAIGVGKIIKTFRTHWGAKISTNPPSTPLPDVLDSTPKSNPNATLFQEYANASGISKRQLEKKIQAIATKETRPPLNRSVWYVHETVMKQYGLSKENFVPLVPDNSLLSPKLTDHQPPMKTPESANQVSKAVKRKNVAGKSLLQFLSRSPHPPSPKRVKTETLSKEPLTSGRTSDEAIILDPPTQGKDAALATPLDEKPTNPPTPKRDLPNATTDSVLVLPLAKKQCLEQVSSTEPPPTDTIPANSSLNIVQDSTGNVLQDSSHGVLQDSTHNVLQDSARNVLQDNVNQVPQKELVSV